MSTLFINFCIHFHTKTFHPNPSLVLWEWVQNENEFYNKNYINLLSGQVSTSSPLKRAKQTFWKLSSWWSGRDESWNHLHLAQLKILFAVFMYNFLLCVSLQFFGSTMEIVQMAIFTLTKQKPKNATTGKIFLIKLQIAIKTRKLFHSMSWAHSGLKLTRNKFCVRSFVEY